MPLREIAKAIEGLDTDQYGRVHSVPSVAELRTLPSEYQQGVARTRGYYAANDGGAGPDWMWDSTAATSATIDGINRVNTASEHGYQTGDLVRFYGTLPPQLSSGTDYYVQRTGTTTFGVVATYAEALTEVNRMVINATASGLSINRGDDGCLTLVPSSNPAAGRWKRMWDGAYMSVLWAGAKGDAGPMTSSGASGTVDTTSLQQAIHLAGPGCTVDFHDRRYRTNIIKLRYSNTILTARGAVLVSDGGSNTGFSILNYLNNRGNNNSSLSATPSLNAGQDVITVTSAQAALLSVGDIAAIGTTEFEPTGNYKRGSYKIVREINGTDITLDSGLDWTLTPANAILTSYKSSTMARNMIIEGLQFELIPAYRQFGIVIDHTENVEIRNCKFYGGAGANTMIAIRFRGFDLRVHDCYIQDFLDVPNLELGYGVAFNGHNARIHNNTFLRCKHATTGGGDDYMMTRMHIYANYAWDCHTSAYDIHANSRYCKLEDNFYLEIGKTNHSGTGGNQFYTGIYLRGPYIECRRNVLVATKMPASNHIVSGIQVYDGAVDNVVVEDNRIEYCDSAIKCMLHASFTRFKNMRFIGNQFYRQPTPTAEMVKSSAFHSDGPLHDSELIDNYVDVNVHGFYLSGVKNTKIAGNKVTWGNTTDTWPRVGGTTAAGIVLVSNAAETHVGAQITDNIFAAGAAVAGQTTVAHIRIQANHNDVTISNNQFDNTNLNAGAATIRYDEATQLTRMVRQANIGDKFTTQSITAAATQIKALGSLVVLTANAVYTLSTVPIIPDGFDGQKIVLFNNGAQNIIVRDQGTLANSNLRLTGTSVTIGPRDTLSLRFSSAIGDWIQTAPLTTII